MKMHWPDISAESRRIIALAWPVVLTNLNWTLMHLADVIIVGGAGTDQLSALAAARVVSFVVIVMGLAGMSGILVHVSRADGAKDLPRTGDLLRQGIVMALVIGLMSFLFLRFAGGPLLRFTGVAPELIRPGGAVVRAMAIGFPGQMLLVATAYFLEGVSCPRRVMLVNIGMLPVNALLAWAWVGGHFGFPALGAVGAALATSTASLAGGGLMLAMAWTLPRAVERHVRDLSLAAWIAAVREMPRLLWFGVVPALGAGVELVGFSYIMILSTRLGEVTAAAFQTMLSLHNLGFALGLGLGSAAGVRVGNAVGAKEAWEAFPRAALAALLSLIGMGTLVCCYLAMPGALVGLLASDPAVKAQAALMLFILAPFILMDGLQAIFMSALRSLGDQVAAGINGIIGFFVVMAGAGWYFYTNGHGPAGLAYACGIGMAATALLQGGRLVTVSRRYRQR